MRKNVLNTFLITLVYLSLVQNLYSWEKTYTHPAISQEAATASQLGTYLQSQFDYAEGLNTQLHVTNTSTPFIQDLIDRGMNPNITTRSILEWTREGSKLEDAYVFQARSQHHFHDPIRNSGLDNKTDHPDYSSLFAWVTGIYTDEFDVTGQFATTWAIEPEPPKETVNNSVV